MGGISHHLRHLFGTQERGLEWRRHFKVVMEHAVAAVTETNNATQEEGPESIMKTAEAQALQGAAKKEASAFGWEGWGKGGGTALGNSVPAATGEAGLKGGEAINLY